MKKIFFITSIALLCTASTQGIRLITLKDAASTVFGDIVRHMNNTSNADSSPSLQQKLNATPKPVLNEILKTIQSHEPANHRTIIKLLVLAGGDPNILNPHQIPLVTALINQDNDYTRFLLEHYADPNLYMQHTLININKHQETGSPIKIKTWDNKPAFYYAIDPEFAGLCMLHGANPRLLYRTYDDTNTLRAYGNVLTHVLDNPDYDPSLIAFWINHGAFTYSSSHESNGGSVLHHLLYKLKSTGTSSNPSHDEIQRLIASASYLVTAQPKLLESKDDSGKTPQDYIALANYPVNTEYIIKELSTLFAKVAIKTKE